MVHCAQSARLLKAASLNSAKYESAYMQGAEILTRRLLVLGGARSGKSPYEQRLAEATSLQPVLIATAEAQDAEMAQRIARHAAARSARWALIEEPAALAEALCREASKDRIIVVDCVTLWLRA